MEKLYYRYYQKIKELNIPITNNYTESPRPFSESPRPFLESPQPFPESPRPYKEDKQYDFMYTQKDLRLTQDTTTTTREEQKDFMYTGPYNSQDTTTTKEKKQISESKKPITSQYTEKKLEEKKKLSAINLPDLPNTDTYDDFKSEPKTPAEEMRSRLKRQDAIKKFNPKDPTTYQN